MGKIAKSHSCSSFIIDYLFRGIFKEFQYAACVAKEYSVTIIILKSY
jgi:hypothetical protein